MSGETLAVFLAAAIGIALAIHLQRRDKAQTELYSSPLNYSAWSQVPVGTLPSGPATWALLL